MKVVIALLLFSMCTFAHSTNVTFQINLPPSSSGYSGYNGLLFINNEQHTMEFNTNSFTVTKDINYDNDTFYEYIIYKQNIVYSETLMSMREDGYGQVLPCASLKYDDPLWDDGPPLLWLRFFRKMFVGKTGYYDTWNTCDCPPVGDIINDRLVYNKATFTNEVPPADFPLCDHISVSDILVLKNELESNTNFNGNCVAG